MPAEEGPGEASFFGSEALNPALADKAFEALAKALRSGIGGMAAKLLSGLAAAAAAVDENEDEDEDEDENEDEKGGITLEVGILTVEGVVPNGADDSWGFATFDVRGAPNTTPAAAELVLAGNREAPIALVMAPGNNGGEAVKSGAVAFRRDEGPLVAKGGLDALVTTPAAVGGGVEEDVGGEETGKEAGGAAGGVGVGGVGGVGVGGVGVGVAEVLE